MRKYFEEVLVLLCQYGDKNTHLKVGFDSFNDFDNMIKYELFLKKLDLDFFQGPEFASSGVNCCGTKIGTKLFLLHLRDTARNLFCFFLKQTMHVVTIWAKK